MYKLVIGGKGVHYQKYNVNDKKKKKRNKQPTNFVNKLP